VRDVFISYAREDKPKAELIVQALGREGLSVWWDRKIPPGKSYSEMIGQALDSAKCIIVLWSKQSVASDWVKDEAEEGKRRRILVPAMIEDVIAPLGFRQFQTANLIGWKGDSAHPELHELLDAVSAQVGRGRSRTESVAPAACEEAQQPVPKAPQQASGIIFICYRREDSAPWAGRLSDRLSDHFPSNQIFMDVGDLAQGVDFVEAIEANVGSCDVLIAIIGKRWLILSDKEGKRGIDNPEDVVRMEIATALRRDIRVIPVLVDGASMPRLTDLPDDLKPLVRRNALQVSDTGFDDDCRRLVAAIEQVLEKKSAEQLEREQKDRLEAGRRETEAKERLETERRAKEAILRRSLKANVEKEPGEGSLALLRFWRSLPRSVRGTLGVLTAGLMIFLVPKLIIEYGPWAPHLKTKPTPVIQTAQPTPPLSGWVFYGVVGESMYSHTDFTIVNRDGDIWPRAQDTIVAKYPVKVQDAPELEFSYPRPAPPAPQLGAPSQEDTSPQKDTIPAGAQLKVLEVIQSRANPPDPWGQHVWIRF
jgi:hypothetical protein